MNLTNTFMTILCLACTFVYGQSDFQQKPPELPINLSWDESGILIRTQRKAFNSSDFLRIQPAEHLDKVGNDLIRIQINDDETPIVIDFTPFFAANSTESQDSDQIQEPVAPYIDIYRPSLSLEYGNERGQYKLVLNEFAKSRRKEKQIFIIKGLDAFLVESDQQTQVEAKESTISVDLSESLFNYLVLRGGTLELTDLENTLPSLVHKYNEKFREDTAFISKGSDEIPQHPSWDLDYVRDLVTKYNITDFDDLPIAYLEEVIFTTKGIGLNLRKLEPEKKGFMKYEEATISVMKNEFFYWPAFINLSFEKFGVSDEDILIQDPYGSHYIYKSKNFFSNVELIQFFKELQYHIFSNLK